jgi:hypothetical protein
MIEKYLKENDIKYLVDSDSDLVVQFAADEDTGIEHTIYLMMDGDVYEILFTGDFKISKRDWAKAVMTCNEWNREKRWPKAVLSVDREKETGEIRLVGALDLEFGVHQELLDDFTHYHVAGGAAFWDWVTGEGKL